MELEETGTAAFSHVDVLALLGIKIVEKRNEFVEAHTGTTALAEFQAAPTIKGLARDLARVAAYASENPESARSQWLNRLVMTRDANGDETDRPLVVGIKFGGRRLETNGVEDIGVGYTGVVEGYGRINIEPLFTVGIDYIHQTPSGVLDGTRVFYGVLFAPKRARDSFKFVPFDLADPKWIERWNGIIDQGKALGTKHGQWQRIEPLSTNIGKPGQCHLELTPIFWDERQFPKRVRGRVVLKDGSPVMETECRIATRFMKVVILHPNSQQIPLVEVQDAEGNVKNVFAPGSYVFSYVERENSIVVMLRGRPGEVSLEGSFVTIDEVGETMQPFEVLGIAIERFEFQKARQDVGRWLAMPLNKANPLFMRAIELGLVIEGQPHNVVLPALQAFAAEALNRANLAYNQAFDNTLENLRKFDAPTIEVLLAGNRLDRVARKLNPDDAAVAWLNDHFETGQYDHGNKFHRALREELLRSVAKRARYVDPPLTPST